MDIQNKQSLRDFWDKVAEEHVSTTTFDYSIFNTVVNNKNAMILDIGCGYGRILQGLHSCGYTNLTGIDISKNMLRRGKKEAPHLNLAHTDGVPFEFANQTFDVVLLLGVLCSVVSNQDQTNMINDAQRL